jgi:nucleotide-binding universal stress UspA family protein
MKIVLAVDGSKCTKKALAFLVTHENLAGDGDEVLILNVQPTLPPRVRSAVGAQVAVEYQTEEAEKVLKPIGRFLDKHSIVYRSEWVAGHPAEQILRAAKKFNAHLLVMGTHGHGLLGRAVMGSVAQKVVTEADIPVLLVK